MDITPLALIGLAARWLTFAAILIAVGAITFRLAIAGRAAIGRATLVRATRRAATLGAISAAVVVLPAFARLVIQTSEMRFPDDPWVSVGLRLVAHTSWGTTWIIQLVTTLLLIPAFLAARRPATNRWIAPSFLAVLLAVTPTMSSHAREAHRLASITPLADALHILGAGVWLGTLAVMFASVVRRDGADEGDGQYLAKLLDVFSPVALLGAAIVVLSGTVSSLAHLDHVTSLFRTPYGRTLAVKLGGVLAVFILGWRNWRHTERASDGQPSRMKPAMLTELVVAALVLLVTAALVVTPPPMDGM